MLTCIYKGESISSLSINNKYGVDDYNLKQELKIAGSKNQLVCDECGSFVFLRAGEIRIPHFAHKNRRDANCYYEIHRDTEDEVEFKSIFFSYFSEHRDSSLVKVNFKHENGRRSDIYVEFNDGNKLAIILKKKSLTYSDLKKRTSTIEDLGVKVLWFINSKDQAGNFVEQAMIHELDQIQRIFDIKNKATTLRKKIEVLDENQVVKEREYFTRIYPLDKLEINSRGELECDFGKMYETIKNKYIENYNRKVLEEEKRRKGAQVKSRKTIWEENNKNPKIDLPKKRIPESPQKSDNTQKSYMQLQSEAEEIFKQNPHAPIFDSQRNRWGTCISCGQFTSKWYTFNGKNNTCECYDCKD